MGDRRLQKNMGGTKTRVGRWVALCPMVLRGRSTRRQGVGTRQLLASAPIHVRLPDPGLAQPDGHLVKYDAWVVRFTPSRMIMHCACLLPLENGNRRLPGTLSARTGAVSRAPKFKPRPPTVPGLPGLPFRPPLAVACCICRQRYPIQALKPSHPAGSPWLEFSYLCTEPAPTGGTCLPGYLLTWRIQRENPLRVTYQGT